MTRRVILGAAAAGDPVRPAGRSRGSLATVGEGQVPAARSPVVATPADPRRSRRSFIGNMAYAITDGKTTLYTDFPYQSGHVRST